MSANRRRQQNKVPVRQMSPWLLIAVIAFVGGMTFVYFKNQQHARGREIKALEHKLAALRSQNESLCAMVERLSSYDALKGKLRDQVVKMVPISRDQVVQVAFPAKGRGPADEIRVVANAGGLR